MRRIAVTVCCLLLLWGAYAEFANYLVWDLAQSYGRESPVASVLPTPLSDPTIAQLTGPRLSGFGLSFQVPRQVEEPGRQSKSVMVRKFVDGGAVILTQMPVDTAKMWREGSGSGATTIIDLLGADALRSNYDLMAAAVQVTPADSKLWATRKQNVRAMMLLGNKTLQGDPNAKAIHPIQGGSVRGFQFGDPSVEPYVVALDLFDQQHRQFHLVISGKGQKHPNITQSQINALVASVQTVPES